MSETASPDAEARLALERIDEVLRGKPEKNDAALNDVMEKLCIWRDRLIAQARQGGEVERIRLEHANAVLSVVVAIHFPAGAIPWDELVAARRWLAELVGNVGEPAPGG
jgi:hypothetical protein